jgi:hypothetical protein
MKQPVYIESREDGWWRFRKILDSGWSGCKVYESSWTRSNTPAETERKKEKTAEAFHQEGYLVKFRFIG